MSIDPYIVMGVDPESDDETIRKRYLELVRQFQPEHHPEKFAEIRAAYEKLRDLDSRVHHRLFDQGKKDTIEDVIEELTCRIPRRRFSLQTLIQMQRTRH